MAAAVVQQASTRLATEGADPRFAIVLGHTEVVFHCCNAFQQQQLGMLLHLLVLPVPGESSL
jgi:hypothetical protein